jgi:hypothetical protein
VKDEGRGVKGKRVAGGGRRATGDGRWATGDGGARQAGACSAASGESALRQG